MTRCVRCDALRAPHRLNNLHISPVASPQALCSPTQPKASLLPRASNPAPKAPLSACTAAVGSKHAARSAEAGPAGLPHTSGGRAATSGGAGTPACFVAVAAALGTLLASSRRVCWCDHKDHCCCPAPLLPAGGIKEHATVAARRHRTARLLVISATDAGGEILEPSAGALPVLLEVSPIVVPAQPTDAALPPEAPLRHLATHAAPSPPTHPPPCHCCQPVSYLSLGMTVGTGLGLLWWYNHEKDQKMEDISREGKSSVVVGQVRRRWQLVDWEQGCGLDGR